METINLFGAGGHGKVIKDIVEACGKGVGVVYDDFSPLSDLQGKQICRTSENVVEGPMIISIGSNKIRKEISEKYPVKYITAVHPSAIVASTAKIGEGTVVMQGAIIQTEAEIGTHCIVNTGASVDHECRIANYVHISPHATLCGNVRVGEGAWIGAGATVIPGIRIGKWAVVGAGATVIRDVPDNAVVAGTPAREIRR